MVAMSTNFAGALAAILALFLCLIAITFLLRRRGALSDAAATAGENCGAGGDSGTFRWISVDGKVFSLGKAGIVQQALNRGSISGQVG